MEKRYNNNIKKQYEGHLDLEKQKFIWKEYESKYGTMIKETEVEPLEVVTTYTYKGFPVYDIRKMIQE